MQGGIPALEFRIDDQTCCFALRMNDLRMLAAGQIVILTSSAAECEISPSGPTLIIDFHRYGIHGQGRNFALAVEVLRDGLRRLIDPPREARVIDDGRNEIRVALTDLVWGSVIESGAEISLEGNMIIVRFGADS